MAEVDRSVLSPLVPSLAMLRGRGERRLSGAGRRARPGPWKPRETSVAAGAERATGPGDTGSHLGLGPLRGQGLRARRGHCLPEAVKIQCVLVGPLPLSWSSDLAGRLFLVA